MGAHGELNVGQLVRQRHGRDAVLVGFTTSTGTVTAASAWDGPAERKRVRPALPDSIEDVLHAIGRPRLYLRLRESEAAAAALRDARLERAIGVVYLPETSGRATTSTPSSRRSSTPCCTSMRRPPSSRWSARRPGTTRSRRRPIRRGSDGRDQ
jgi:erythromycin esterase-like protein